MVNKKKHQTQLRVQMKYAPTFDADARFSRVIEILLKAAARDTSQTEDSPDADKEKPSARGTHEATGEGQCKDGNDWKVPD